MNLLATRRHSLLRMSEQADPPTIVTHPQSVTVALNEYATFSVAANGTNLSYQWYYLKPTSSSWVKWSGKTDSSLSFKGLSTNDGNQYRCVVSNEYGSVTSDTATLRIL